MKESEGYSLLLFSLLLCPRWPPLSVALTDSTPFLSGRRNRTAAAPYLSVPRMQCVTCESCLRDSCRIGLGKQVQSANSISVKRLFSLQSSLDSTIFALQEVQWWWRVRAEMVKRGHIGCVKSSPWQEEARGQSQITLDSPF